MLFNANAILFRFVNGPMLICQWTFIAEFFPWLLSSFAVLRDVTVPTVDDATADLIALLVNFPGVFVFDKLVATAGFVGKGGGDFKQSEREPMGTRRFFFTRPSCPDG